MSSPKEPEKMKISSEGRETPEDALLLLLQPSSTISNSESGVSVSARTPEFKDSKVSKDPLQSTSLQKNLVPKLAKGSNRDLRATFQANANTQEMLGLHAFVPHNETIKTVIEPSVISSSSSSSSSSFLHEPAASSAGTSTAAVMVPSPYPDGTAPISSSLSTTDDIVSTPGTQAMERFRLMKLGSPAPASAGSSQTPSSSSTSLPSYSTTTLSNSSSIPANTTDVSPGKQLPQLRIPSPDDAMLIGATTSVSNMATTTPTLNTSPNASFDKMSVSGGDSPPVLSGELAAEARVRVAAPHVVSATSAAEKAVPSQIKQEAATMQMSVAPVMVQSSSLDNTAQLRVDSSGTNGMNVNVGPMALAKIEPTTPSRNTSAQPPAEDEEHKPCNCKKSKCLKLYCPCFARQVLCTKDCNCCGCMNQESDEYAHLRKKIQEEILERDPYAFFRGNNTEIVTDTDGKTPKHRRGCRCRKSACWNKYCVCYRAGVPCSLDCACSGCRNGDPHGHGTGHNHEHSHSHEHNGVSSALPTPDMIGSTPNILGSVDSGGHVTSSANIAGTNIANANRTAIASSATSGKLAAKSAFVNQIGTSFSGESTLNRGETALLTPTRNRKNRSRTSGNAGLDMDHLKNKRSKTPNPKSSSKAKSNREGSVTPTGRKSRARKYNKKTAGDDKKSMNRRRKTNERATTPGSNRKRNGKKTGGSRRKRGSGAVTPDSSINDLALSSPRTMSLISVVSAEKLKTPTKRSHGGSAKRRLTDDDDWDQSHSHTLSNTNSSSVYSFDTNANGVDNHHDYLNGRNMTSPFKRARQNDDSSDDKSADDKMDEAVALIALIAGGMDRLSPDIMRGSSDNDHGDGEDEKDLDNSRRRLDAEMADAVDEDSSSGVGGGNAKNNNRIFADMDTTSPSTLVASSKRQNQSHLHLDVSVDGGTNAERDSAEMLHLLSCSPAKMSPHDERRFTFVGNK